MKPGPAIVDRLDPALERGLRRAARRSARPRPRADCAAAPWRAASPRCRRGRRGRPGVGVSNAATSAWPGLTSSIAARSASSNSSRARVIGEFYEAGFAASCRAAGSRSETVNKARVAAYLWSHVGARIPDARTPPMSSSSTATVSVPPVAPAAAKAMPAQIGKYRILGRLGDGATSEVFLGFDDFQGRNVAIKRVRSVDRGRPDRRPLLGALLRRRGGAGRQAPAPERGADLRRRPRPGRALPGDGVRGRRHASARTAAPTSCSRSS